MCLNTGLPEGFSLFVCFASLFLFNFNVLTNIDTCDCTQELYEHQKKLCSESWLYENNSLTPRRIGRAQELCESRGGRPGLSRREAALNEPTENRTRVSIASAFSVQRWIDWAAFTSEISDRMCLNKTDICCGRFNPLKELAFFLKTCPARRRDRNKILKIRDFVWEAPLTLHVQFLIWVSFVTVNGTVCTEQGQMSQLARVARTDAVRRPWKSRSHHWVTCDTRWCFYTQSR